MQMCMYNMHISVHSRQVVWSGAESNQGQVHFATSVYQLASLLRAKYR